MAGRHDKFRGIGRIDGSEGVRVACDAGINLAVRRTHGELDHVALENCGGVEDLVRRDTVSGADDEIAIRIRRRERAVWQFLCRDVAGRVRVAGGRRLALGVRWGRSGLREDRRENHHQTNQNANAEGAHDRSHDDIVQHSHRQWDQ